MITPGLFYRLCFVQGACLAAGWGIPSLIQWAASPPDSWTLQAVLAGWMTLLGTWGLLTAATGLMLLRQLRKSSSRQSQEIIKTDSHVVPIEAQLSNKLSPKLSLYRADDIDDIPEHHMPAEWKSQWRHSRIEVMNTAEETQEVV
ncbi:MAG TPA: hypothetical protein VNQ76_09930 [Planctomicrobium sp.]|nr:hypothetical protein [Planctomicrobium sp.]